jgi:hypothetical protein
MQGPIIPPVGPQREWGAQEKGETISSPLGLFQVV